MVSVLPREESAGRARRAVPLRLHFAVVQEEKAN
jgi:hypothetical protein